MRHGRAKSSRRTLQFYRLNAPPQLLLKPPIKILVDGTFLVASIRNKVPLRIRFAKTLGQGAEFELYVVRSTLVELETLSKSLKGRRGGEEGEGEEEEENVFARARRYGLDECTIIETDDIVGGTASSSSSSSSAAAAITAEHERDFSEASLDIFRISTAANDNATNHNSSNNNNNKGDRYFVATQDDALANALRSVPYVPLFRLGSGVVLVLESPSSASRNFSTNREQQKLNCAGGLMTGEERNIMNTLKEKDRRVCVEKGREERRRLEKRVREEVGGSFCVRRKKRAKGPNPLSCKSGGGGGGGDKKR